MSQMQSQFVLLLLSRFVISQYSQTLLHTYMYTTALTSERVESITHSCTSLSRCVSYKLLVEDFNSPVLKCLLSLSLCL